MADKHLEAPVPVSKDDVAAHAKQTLQEAAMTYRVCKDGTVVFPPDVCPQKNYLDFNTKM